MKRITVALILLCLIQHSGFSQTCLSNYTGYNGSTPSCESNDPYPWVLVFNDEFNGNELDLNKWRLPWSGSDDPNSELWMMNSWNTNGWNVDQIPITNNIEFDGSNVNLIVREENPPLQGTWFAPDGNGGLNSGVSSYGHSSALIQSEYLMGYGLYEISGRGYWPAFWTFGGPGWHEIDVFEFWNEYTWGGIGQGQVYDPVKSRTTVSFNIHHDYNGDGNSTNCGSEFTGPDFTQDFHVFSMLYTEDYIYWYVD